MTIALAKKRLFSHATKDLSLVSHDDYIVKRDKFCDDYYRTRDWIAEAPIEEGHLEK